MWKIRVCVGLALWGLACSDGPGSQTSLDGGDVADAPKTTGPDLAQDGAQSLDPAADGCIPQCDFRWCGDDDGCGGRCLRCPAGSTCNLEIPLCECAGVWCGDLVCCAAGERCGPDGTCVPCEPDCAGRDCGDDGCGGSCGTCNPGNSCLNGVCRPDCTPSCNGRECGDDGCGGSCGTCGTSETCVSGTCEAAPKGHVGAACTSDAHCKDPGGVCYPEVYGDEPTGFIHGYCLVLNCSAGTCPSGSDCFQVLEGGGYACLATCSTAADCPQSNGYACVTLSVTGGKKVCWPDCAADTDCPADAFCDVSQEFCVPDALGCSAANPTGYCAGDLVCQAGECKPYQFTCTDQTHEPNETIQQAAPVTPGVQDGLQVCSKDLDWFRLDVPAGNAGTLGLFFTHKLGDLDLCAFDAGGKLLGCRYPFEHHPASWRTYDWNDEYLSAFAIAEARTFYFRADGWNGAVNTYRLDVRVWPWKDGPDCRVFFDEYECAGCDPATHQCLYGYGKANLKQFPFPDPADPYVGTGYVLEHSSSYRWLRREVIMAIRHAIHEVQVRFPGTKPLGLLDMGQMDGGTPGFDVGQPRHPETTHDQGGNIDVAYYQTGPDNLGKVICDPIGGSNNGAYCTNVDNHVVDLPRTAYFLAILADNPRFRVAGVDQMIAPLILAELKKQKDQGWISATAYNRLAGGSLAYGSGWPYHHHHVHVSFKWWSQGLTLIYEPPIGCGFRMPGDRPWPEMPRPRIVR